jgi:hypothetical protein
MTGLLNPAQRNSLTIGLRVLEMDLRRARAWMHSAEERGVLYRRSLSIASEQRAAMVAQIDLALEVIARLAAQFDLSPAEQDLAALFAARMSADWATLVDLKAAKLSRYGHVSEALAERLDPSLDTLSYAVLALASLAGGAPGGENRW